MPLTAHLFYTFLATIFQNSEGCNLSVHTKKSWKTLEQDMVTGVKTNLRQCIHNIFVCQFVDKFMHLQQALEKD